VVVARAATASLPLGRQWWGGGAQWAALDVGARGGTVWLSFIGGERACLHRERTPPAFNSQYGERPRPVRAQGEPARTGGQRRARMVARARTPHGVGVDFKGLGVLPASGRCGLGKARAGPDAEVAGAHARARGCAGARAALWSAGMCHTGNV
jgi:hypothetical protein